MIAMKRGRDPAYTPFRPAELQNETVERYMNLGYDRATAEYNVAQGKTGTHWMNSLYHVHKTEIAAANGFPAMWWLSIKRRDRRPIHDWRHLQRIKNDLVGKEHEAVELYPAESRLVDTSNQFHLWVLQDPELRFPWGWNERLVDNEQGAR